MSSILEIIKDIPVTGFINYSPGVYFLQPSEVTLAEYWVDIFGAENDSVTKKINISTFKANYSNIFKSFNSISAVEENEESFFWDYVSQKLYVNFGLDYDYLLDFFTIGVAYNYCTGLTTYIDDIEYLPLLLSSPSISQSEDLIDYDLLDLYNGTFTLENKDADLDFIINENVIGNDVFFYHLPKNKTTRSDLIKLGSFVVDDYALSLYEFSIDVIDKRKSKDIEIPTEIFSGYENIDPEIEGDIVPLIFGQIRECGVIVVNSLLESGNVDCIVAQELTSLGTVKVEIDNVWTTVTPSFSSLSNGSFTLSESDGRNANGSIRNIKVVNPIGIQIENTADIIVYLANKYEDAKYNEFNFNTEEWESVSAKLSNGGYMINSKMFLYDAYKEIQNGSSLRFRYEFNPEGQRTLRLNDENIFTRGIIYNVDFDEIEVASDSNIIFSKVNINYSKSYYTGNYLKVSNNDYETEIKNTYNKLKELTINSIMNDSAAANYKALADAERFKIFPETTTLKLYGSDFLDIRIYDIWNIELTKGFTNIDNLSIKGREFYGYRRCQVLSINPDSDNETNVVKFKVLGYAKLQEDLIFDNNDILVFDDYITMSTDGLE